MSNLWNFSALTTSVVNDPPVKNFDATPGEDYIVYDTEEAIFSPGETTQVVKLLSIIDDVEIEATEYFMISLGSSNCTVFGNNQFLIRIEDNDGKMNVINL